MDAKTLGRGNFYDPLRYGPSQVRTSPRRASLPKDRHVTELPPGPLYLRNLQSSPSETFERRQSR